jgi:hypothetical protein
MNEMVKQAKNETLTDEEFGDEIFLMYTEKHKKRYIAEHNMIRKIRSNFKRGDTYAMDVLNVIFPPHLPDTISREQLFRHHIEMERMQAKMKQMEQKIESMERGMQEWILTQKEQFYDCHE